MRKITQLLRERALQCRYLAKQINLSHGNKCLSNLHEMKKKTIQTSRQIKAVPREFQHEQINRKKNREVVNKISKLLHNFSKFIITLRRKLSCLIFRRDHKNQFEIFIIIQALKYSDNCSDNFLFSKSFLFSKILVCGSHENFLNQRKQQ